MKWKYELGIWILYDNVMKRCYVFENPITKKWTWLLFDDTNNLIDYSREGPTERDTKSDAEAAVLLYSTGK